jgi:PAS domain S-box-containing protein
MVDPIRVLHVADSASAERTATALGEEGLTVHTEGSARDALDRLERGDTEVDCVVGAGLAGMDGPEFVDAVREARPDLPVVLFVGTDGDGEVATEATTACVQNGEEASHALLAKRVKDVVDQHRLGAERYRAYVERVLDAIHDPLFVHDADGSLRRWNEAFTEVTGYSEAEVAAMDGTDFVPAEHRERTAAAIADVFETGSARLEAPLLTRDGETIPYEFVATRVEHTGGGARLVGVGRDVSERVARARELERKNERLEEFASIVSHDLRNPLSVAEGQVELLRGECDSDRLDALQRAHDRMETLVEDLLTLARQGEAVSDTEPVNLAETVEACWRTVSTADADLRVGADCVVGADPSRLKQLIENLLRNAVEHGSTSSRSAAEDPVEHRGADVTVWVGDLDGGFYVADDGPGIPESERERVFESGHSTAAEGTGFGLAIVAEVAAAHGWAVEVVESDAGGARFEVTGVETARVPR